ncbi:coiled-coil domain-containing protein 81-like [Gallus gallus]|uniref:coiled-coil domain-containing protein 81-like n=1 Tax=Gallus gallus TaxID=9031 RepID=UPI001F01B2EB|nr:coiled-coil domain-containing protein 81-like [Gallus gallus]
MHLEGMSSHVAVANAGRPAAVKRAKIQFWEDGPATQRDYKMPEVTAKERVAVWDAVAVYVQEQLLLRKGVRIPTFGSFSIVSERIEAEDGAMTLQWPAFCLARNLAGIHNLMESYPPGHKEVQPLKYTEVAAAASVTWQTGKACIFGTTSLVSHCLRKGENIAFVLKDIGVLLIEGTRVQMKFYYDFLERISGKENLEKVVFKVPRLRGHGGVPGGSCSLPDVLWPSHRLSQAKIGDVTVCLFRREFVPKPPPRTARKACHVPLPPLDQGKKEELPELPPLPSWIRVTFLVEKQPEKETSDVKKKAR